ncbi:Fructose-1,6-bisphosphatase class 1 [Candidatus Brocadiaceae bacterium B188]|nr:class 1 fructose-bisphosphatase [Candidatus Brocadia sapporoensis]QQR65755.1 MAG: class 1 fructose-bisphosphatase [Candidatus Brocadia sp.]RZV59741.1 MAG: class 1 fructose-bisphosphatase [Candidatus Brocadia sp. BROELEC01]TWU50082.1 Fructose-1,6-bisphosphatase class 1 [Candidatus Brocadiaceae bacterium B188]
MQKSKGITIQRHIIEQERLFPQATGDFTGLLWDLSIAAKIISREVNKAGLAEILGLTGGVNIHGEAVKKLDVYANERICRSMEHGGHLCIMASEENEDVIPIPDEFPKGKYVLMFDPLDGSSNIDANVSVGTIFSIYRRKTTGKEATVDDCLRKGTEQVAAGYIVYGSSTMMVYTTGHGVYGFTLDPSIGEFLLSHEKIKIPPKGKIYSINEGNTYVWDEGTQRYISYLKENDSLTGRPYSLRYIGSLVADFHRNLLYGGIFLYPADYKDPGKPKPKLRLLYEANPLAFIVEQAGGMASTGKERILDIQATELHQKVPLVIGSKEDVLTYERFFCQGGK